MKRSRATTRCSSRCGPARLPTPGWPSTPITPGRTPLTTRLLSSTILRLTSMVTSASAILTIRARTRPAPTMTSATGWPSTTPGKFPGVVEGQPVADVIVGAGLVRARIVRIAEAEVTIEVKRRIVEERSRVVNGVRPGVIGVEGQPGVGNLAGPHLELHRVVARERFIPPPVH